MAKSRAEVCEERLRRRGEQGWVEEEQRRMVEAEERERRGAERLRREVEEERAREALGGLVEEAERLETVKAGMERRVEEVDREMVKRRGEWEGQCKRMEGRTGASGSIYEIEVEELLFYRKKVKIMKK